jgi:hypothetical protein
MRPLKVYICNFDGRVERGVYTTTQKRALELLDVKAHVFREYGHVIDAPRDADAQLRAAPDVAMETRISTWGDKWFPLDTMRRYRLYEYECNRAGTTALALDDWFNQQEKP